MRRIKIFGLINTYDIIKKYTNCHAYATAIDIILIFDADITRIT